MGLDEALLLETDAPPTLRLYQWQPAGLSIGYFQSSSYFRERPADCVLVRRLTGGGAILHDAELTFSLTLANRYLPGGIAESYRLIHAAVARALDAIGVPSRFPHASETSTTPGSARPQAPWCFADPTPEDLLSHSGKKLLGSAQRRIRRPTERILHHGSLVLRTPVATPFCGSVEESIDPAAVLTKLQDALISELSQALGLHPEPGTPTSNEQRRAEQLAEERYANDAFTHRR